MIGYRFTPAIALMLAALAWIAPQSAARATGALATGPEGVRLYKTTAPFADAVADLNDAIVNRGLHIDYHGFIGRMLDRTAADVGASEKIYANAEFFTFCSATFSRDMMAADPGNIGYCPYVVFAFERAATPGVVEIGYRRLPITGDAAAQKALTEIDALLDGIVKEAAGL